MKKSPTELSEWIQLSTSVKDQNPFWTYKIDQYEIPGKGQGTYYYVDTAGSSFIIPITSNGKILLVKQYRYLNRRMSWEFPGGGIKAGEHPENVAQKELIEETGFSGSLHEVGSFNPYNGVTNEICYVFIATDLIPSQEFEKDHSEDFIIQAFSVDAFEKMIQDKIIYDGMTLAAWALGKNQIQKIT